MDTEETPCKRALDMIRLETVKNGGDMVLAARIVRRREPALCLTVMEAVGSWPSSDPELLALQRIW